MVLNNGLICEVQHSPINPEQIRERESFYAGMIWILDAREPYWKGNFEVSRPWTFNRREYVSIWWKYKKKAAWTFRRQVYIDTGEDIYRFEGFPDGRYFTQKMKFRARKLERFEFITSLQRENKKKRRPMIAYYDEDKQRVRWRAE
ncbi:hypothetical protein ACWIDW_04880 [Microbacterium sp. NPDC055312]